MKTIVLSLAFSFAALTATAQQTTVITVTTAQATAEQMARVGILRHCGTAGGRREGIGFSSVSADAAIKNCCFWGKFRAREIGVAKGRKGYYAVVWYE